MSARNPRFSGGQVRIEGLQELQRALEKLEDKTQRRLLNRAVNEGAKVIRNQARENAPVDEGNLRKSVITAKRRAWRKGIAVYAVALKRDTYTYANSKANRRMRRAGQSYQTDGPAFYGKFIEFGTSKMAARPFMAPAFEQRKEDAMRAIARKLGEDIAVEAKKEGVR